MNVYPLPEALDNGEGWTVKSNHKNRADVDFNGKTVYVPFQDDETSHNIRMQQLARIQWDDSSVPSNPDSLLFRALEDSRLSLLMRDAGLDVSRGFIDLHAIKALQGKSQDAAALAVLLLTQYTDQAVPESEMDGIEISDRVRDAFKTATAEIRQNPTKRVTADLYQRIKKVISDVSMQDIGPSFMTGKPQRRKQGDMEFSNADDFFDEAWDDLEDLDDVPPELRDALPDPTKTPDTLKAKMDQIKAQPNANFVPWGSMSIHEPGRSISLAGKIHKKWKPTDEGVYPRYNHRLFMDQRIFATRRRMPGGTVLIDASGSMALDQTQIEAMVHAAPGCTVACYSGNADRGVLRILARNGMCVQPELCVSPHGGGNVVDYPALKWAYKQKHPHIWVSDTHATGINDQLGTGNFLMCAAAVQKGRFFVAPHADAAIAVLKRLGSKYRI